MVKRRGIAVASHRNVEIKRKMDTETDRLKAMNHEIELRLPHSNVSSALREIQEGEEVGIQSRAEQAQIKDKASANLGRAACANAMNQEDGEEQDRMRYSETVQDRDVKGRKDPSTKPDGSPPFKRPKVNGRCENKDIRVATSKISHSYNELEVQSPVKGCRSALDRSLGNDSSSGDKGGSSNSQLSNDGRGLWLQPRASKEKVTLRKSSVNMQMSAHERSPSIKRAGLHDNNSSSSPCGGQQISSKGKQTVNSSSATVNKTVTVRFVGDENTPLASRTKRVLREKAFFDETSDDRNNKKIAVGSCSVDGVTPRPEMVTRSVGGVTPSPETVTRSARKEKGRLIEMSENNSLVETRLMDTFDSHTVLNEMCQLELTNSHRSQDLVPNQQKVTEPCRTTRRRQKSPKNRSANCSYEQHFMTSVKNTAMRIVPLKYVVTARPGKYRVRACVTDFNCDLDQGDVCSLIHGFCKSCSNLYDYSRLKVIGTQVTDKDDITFLCPRCKRSLNAEVELGAELGHAVVPAASSPPQPDLTLITMLKLHLVDGLGLCILAFVTGTSCDELLGVTAGAILRDGSCRKQVRNTLSNLVANSPLLDLCLWVHGVPKGRHYSIVETSYQGPRLSLMEQPS